MNNQMPFYKRMFIMGLVFGLCFVAGCSLPRFVNFAFWDPSGHNRQDAAAVGEPVNILLLGIDARPGEENARTDTMILVHIDPQKKKVAAVSIPRDTRVPIGDGTDKINAANVVRGPEYASELVGDLLGINVDYYVLTNFQGFARCVDALGGVTINVEKRMLKRSEGIDLYPGVQRLDGKKALAYVRFRSDSLGDIGRTERQQKFMIAFAKEMFSTNAITKLPALIPELRRNVKTNMGLGMMLKLASMAPDFKPENLYCQTLPGYFYVDPDNHLSYWIADKEKARRLIATLMEGRKVAVVEEVPYSMRQTTSHEAGGNEALLKPLPEEAAGQTGETGQDSLPGPEVYYPESSWDSWDVPGNNGSTGTEQGVEPGTGNNQTAEPSNPVVPQEPVVNSPSGTAAGSNSGSSEFDIIQTNNWPSG